MRRPRKRAQPASFMRSRSMPSNLSMPLACPAPPRWPITAYPMLVLPEPDSPTTPTISPAASVSDTPCTAATALRPCRYLTHRFPIARSASDMRGRPAEPRSDALLQPVANNVDADHGENDAERRTEDHPRGRRDVSRTLGDHQPPVGRRRLDADPEISQRADQQNRVGEAQACLDQDVGPDVRQDFAHEDGGLALADDARRGHEIKARDVEHDAARDARGARRKN